MFDCKFGGTIKKCFFRGELNRCDFRSAQFIDCAFYGAELTDCRMSENTLLFKNWPAVYPEICQRIDAQALSAGARLHLSQWCEVWSELDGVTRDEVIDHASLLQLESLEVVNELFQYLKSLNRHQEKSLNFLPAADFFGGVNTV
jgi:hypothetical protein